MRCDGHKGEGGSVGAGGGNGQVKVTERGMASQVFEGGGGRRSRSGGDRGGKDADLQERVGGGMQAGWVAGGGVTRRRGGGNGGRWKRWAGVC
jgi:hypothetical protein